MTFRTFHPIPPSSPSPPHPWSLYIPLPSLRSCFCPRVHTVWPHVSCCHGAPCPRSLHAVGCVGRHSCSWLCNTPLTVWHNTLLLAWRRTHGQPLPHLCLSPRIPHSLRTSPMPLSSLRLWTPCPTSQTHLTSRRPTASMRCPPSGTSAPPQPPTTRSVHVCGTSGATLLLQGPGQSLGMMTAACAGLGYKGPCTPEAGGPTPQP